VEQFFSKLGRRPRSKDDVGTRVALLLRLAELQRARPEKAIAALEHAEELDRASLGPEERRLLAELYEEADVTGAKVLANHAELLAVDPLHGTGLAALGQHFAISGDNARADAL